MEELGRKSVDEFKQAEKFPIIVVLENIRSAYNVGSVFRTCDAFQIKKTALGAEETVSWKFFKMTADAIEELKIKKYKVYAVEQAEGSYKLHSANFKQNEKIAVVFGNEVTGIEQSTIQLCEGCIEIPQFGMKHSLNIATAAGVVLWELIRNKMRPAVKGRMEH